MRRSDRRSSQIRRSPPLATPPPLQTTQTDLQATGDAVVVGMGLNINWSHLPEELAEIATAVSLVGLCIAVVIDTTHRRYTRRAGTVCLEAHSNHVVLRGESARDENHSIQFRRWVGREYCEAVHPIPGDNVRAVGRTRKINSNDTAPSYRRTSRRSGRRVDRSPPASRPPCRAVPSR